MAGYKGGGWNVAAIVHEVPGSIGCADLLWVRENHLKYAAVKNFDGEFVSATSDSIMAAGASTLPFIQAKAPDFRLSITNNRGKMAYPVSSFLWILLYDDDDYKDKKQHEAMIDFLKWILTNGQELAPKLGYSPLPSRLVDIELRRLDVRAKQ
jgi:phosphate transport system substrate-binding protein